jgi:uncharacterized protein (TIRG00374 family)
MTARRRGLAAAPAAEPPRRRFSWWRALFSLALLAAVCSTINWREEVALLRHVVWGWVAAAVLLHVINRLISAVKWRVLLQAKGLAHPYGDLLQIIWVSNFFGHFLPSAVGGDSLRMWQVARRSERAPEAVSTVFVERLTGLMSLAGLAVLGGLWSYARWEEHLIIVMLLVPLAALLAILAALWTPGGERALQWALSHFRRLPGHQFLLKAVEAVQSFRHHPRALILSLGLSGLVQFNRVLAVLCLAQAAGTALYLGEAFVVIPSALFIAMLPLTVGGLGLHEGAFIVLLGFIGIGKPEAFALALLNRFAAITSNLPGGALFLFEGFRRQRAAMAGHAPRDGSRRLRVLWLADKLGYGDRLHGLGHYYLRIIPACREVEIVPVVLRCTPGAREQFAHLGLQLRTIRGALYDPRVFLRIWRLVRAEQIDAIQVHGYRATALGRAVGWVSRRPVIVRQGDSVPVDPIAQWADRLFGWTTRDAIAVSNSVRRFCIERRGIPADRITVLPNAVARAANGAAPPLPVPSGARLIGSITRLHPVKGVRDLVAAMAEVVRDIPEAHLVLWGDGPEHQALETLAGALGIAGHVHFLGYQPDAARHLGALDCFVLPSLSEGSPNALLEAMAAGCPIVATRVGGVTELVTDGQEALLVEPGAPRALAAAIVSLLRDRGLAQRLARAAEAASLRCSMEAHVGVLTRLYRAAAGSQERFDGRP